MLIATVRGGYFIVSVVQIQNLSLPKLKSLSAEHMLENDRVGD